MNDKVKTVPTPVRIPLKKLGVKEVNIVPLEWVDFGLTLSCHEPPVLWESFVVENNNTGSLRESFARGVSKFGTEKDTPM